MAYLHFADDKSGVEKARNYFIRSNQSASRKPDVRNNNFYIALTSILLDATSSYDVELGAITSAEIRNAVRDVTTTPKTTFVDVKASFETSVAALKTGTLRFVTKTDPSGPEWQMAYWPPGPVYNDYYAISVAPPLP